MSKFKVRFNLGAGEHYMKWKVTSPDGKVNYYDPELVSLHMYDCKLRNHPTTAKKIHDGANKTVCAWIDCDDVRIYPKFEFEAEPVIYNPRNAPHWCDINGKNVDNKKYKHLYTNHKKVYTS